jgi:hypothetical protein
MTVKFYLSNHKQGVVTIDWKTKGSWYVLSILKSSLQGIVELPDVPYKYTEQTVMAYSLYKMISNKLESDPSTANKTKFASVKCNYINGSFIITIATQNTFSAVRKILKDSSKVLDVSKTKTSYTRLLTQLGYKFDKSVWEHVCKEMVASMNSSLAVSFVGKIKIDKDKLTAANDAWDAKQSTSGSKGSPPSDEKQRSEFKLTHGMHHTKSALGSLLISHLLNTKKIDNIIVDGGVKLLIGKSDVKTITSKIKASDIEKFVQQKLLKVNTSSDQHRLLQALRALASLSGVFTTSEIGSVRDDKKFLVDVLKKSL